MTDFETHPAGTGKRIEQLEAKIYKAVVSLAHAEEQLVLAAHAPEYVDLNEVVDLIGRINSTITELKGQDDE